MPTQVSYPGVYVEELPSGVRTITGVATSITAFLGRAARGPVNDGTTITSYGDFERTFGGLELDYPMSYAVRDFFLNGGGQAVIVRLFKANAGSDGIAEGILGTATVTAVSPGIFGNRVRVEVNTNGIAALPPDVLASLGVTAADLFNLSVLLKSEDGATSSLVEVIRNVTHVPASSRCLDEVVKRESSYIRATLPTAAIPGGTAVDLASGDDGGALTARADYIGTEPTGSGLHALDKVDLFNLLCIPANYKADLPANVYGEAATYCVSRRALLIVDAMIAWNVNGSISQDLRSDARAQARSLQISGTDGRNAAVFFPRANQVDADGAVRELPTCGMVAGIMASTDSTRGVWKAPAGLDAALRGIHSLAVKLTDKENGILNPVGINCLRSFPASGNVVWGARTLRGDDQLGDEYKYIPVRRTALFIEESLYRGTQWAVFEPNDEPLWAQMRLNIGAFMHDLFRQGAFQGRTSREAYFVKCDKETTTQSDINRGIVNVIVGFAPLKPAEFVVIKLTQIAGQIEV